MKNFEKSFAKINVKRSEPKMTQDGKRQELDKEGNPLYNVHILEEKWNEEFKVKESNIVRYKSLTHLEEGENYVALKCYNMAQGTEKFLKVNSFYTITQKLDAKNSLKELFAHVGIDGGRPMVTPKKGNTTTAQAVQ